jgi:DNA invertase Pin-like site-specific DNA recombinase
MKIAYVKQTFKCLISHQINLLEKNLFDKIKILSDKNELYDEINSLRENDEIVITRFIILADNLQELLNLLQLFEEKNIKITVIEQNFNNQKNIKLNILIPELLIFLEDIRKQRQIMGIIKAKAKGKKMGRKRKLSEKKLEKAIVLKELGFTNSQIAAKFNVGRSTLIRNIQELKKAI